MQALKKYRHVFGAGAAAMFTIVGLFGLPVFAQTPTIDLNGLAVRTVVDGLTTPTSIAFLGDNDFFVAEKNTGRVLRVNHGNVTTVLDLPVNFASERGLLGIAIHPDFPTNPGVYLFWTCRGPANSPVPLARTCLESSLTVSDTNDVLAVPLLGNRVDRFVWNGTNLVFQQNLVMLRSYQNDGMPMPPAQGDDGQPARGNHDGGIIEFGPDGKLYVLFGDQGRRSDLQNRPLGNAPDDQFGGPQADDAHFSGLILRMNPDGTAPTDNPFFGPGTVIGGEVGDNIKLLFAYGIRNSFGMTVDPTSGVPWITEHGDDSFDEINRIEPGTNGGWTQVMGPLSRIAQFKEIETTFFAPPEPFPSLQQWRYPPSLIANTPQEALNRMIMLPGAQYSDPELSWKWATLPVGLEFIQAGLGSSYEGNIFASLVGPPTGPGYLIRLIVSDDSENLVFTDPRLEDGVADNGVKYDLTESESLIIGSGYGIATDLEMSPSGTLFVVSFTNGAIYEIFATNNDEPRSAEDDEDNDGPGGRPLSASLTGSEEVPGPGDPDGHGTASLRLNQGQGTICYELSVSGIAPATAAHIHRGEAGVAGPVVVPLDAPTDGFSSGCAQAGKDLIKAIRQNPGDYYVNVHNSAFPGGAIRGQLSK